MSIRSDEVKPYFDGLGNMFNTRGDRLLTVRADNLGSPLESCLTFRDFIRFRPDEEPQNVEKAEEALSSEVNVGDVDQMEDVEFSKPKRDYKTYSYEIKKRFLVI